jgi:hypothetical protein
MGFYPCVEAHVGLPPHTPFSGLIHPPPCRRHQRMIPCGVQPRPLEFLATFYFILQKVIGCFSFKFLVSKKHVIFTVL